MLTRPLRDGDTLAAASLVVALMLTACPAGGDGETTGLTTGGTGTTTDVSPTSTGPDTPTTQGPPSNTDTSTSEATTGTTTLDPTTTGDTSTGTAGDTTGTSTGSTGDTTGTTVDTTTTTTGGDPVCEEEVAQSFVPTGLVVDTSALGIFAQGSWFDPIADKICFVIYDGEGLCFKPDGTPLGEVQAPATNTIDGAIYDAAKNVVLFVQADCLVFEADPSTLKKISEVQLDTQQLGLQTCSAIALVPDTNDLYIASYNSNEVVKISRDGQTELGRIDLAPAMIAGPDGLNVISGSGDLLLVGTAGNQRRAAVVSAAGAVIVPGAESGQDQPPIKGGDLNLPDDTLTLCANGHVWVCDQAQKCVEYMPEGGDKNICGCFQGCEPKEETEGVCDGVDDDCNGAIDDYDAAGDGICDCTTMAVLGSKGQFEATKFEAFLDEQSPGWQRFPDINPLTAEALADFDVLILDDIPRTYTKAESDALRDWVLAGGGLAVMAGYAINGDRQSSILQSLEVEYGGPPVTEDLTQFSVHPLTKHITSLPNQGGNYITDLKGDGVTLATLNGKIYALAAQRGLGRIYLYADEWVQFDEVWDSQAEQFWLNALAWLSTGGGNCGLAPTYAETCAELHAEYPGAVDGENTLYVSHDPTKPWKAYCKDMAGAPKEYLSLVEVGEGHNFSQYTAGGESLGTDVRTKFTRVRIDPLTHIVNIDDLTYSSSSGQLMHGNNPNPVTKMPYAVAENCFPDMATGIANVDLTGTPFKILDTFCSDGQMVIGQATISPDGKVADLTAGGKCSWTSPTLGNNCTSNPHEFSSGPALDLEYVAP